MAASELTFDQILQYFIDNGGCVKNRDAVRHFKPYLTDPESREDARAKFKQTVNTIAQVKLMNDEKYLLLKTKYTNYSDTSQQPSPQRLLAMSPPPPPVPALPTHYDPNAIGIPTSPSDYSGRTPPKQPPPYRPPPPVAPSSPSISIDTMSVSSLNMSQSDVSTPQPPPRRKSTDKLRSPDESVEAMGHLDENVMDKQPISVKERTQKFNRLASVDDELNPSPRQQKIAEKNKLSGADEDDGASVASLEPKKCVEWYVTASKGDLQELVKMAHDEPRLVNRKDPFTAYTVLHWGAKHGNAEIIKVFAGTYKVDVNAKTNGGYTPLHIAAQFGHKDIFKLLIEVYKANPNTRDYSGRTPEYYLLAKEQKRPSNLNKIKGRKKQSDKDLGFLRIGSLNVRVKKTTEAFSNFLGVGNVHITPSDSPDKVHKGWGSADNVNQQPTMLAPKTTVLKKKSKRPYDSASMGTPATPKQPTKGINIPPVTNDSDSDTAAGFDCNWKS